MSLEKITRGDEQTKSLDLVNDNINKLRELFPEIITEGKIDFKALQEILGEELEEGEEYYRFTWAGKAQARREAHKPSTGTLRPCKEESVDWDTTQNLYIEGDNLEVLKLMQKSYANKVKMIYIDPPYNTGKDFVYKDNYKDNLKNYQQVTGQVDDEGNKLSTNSESDGRYHSNWLNMIYPRLRLARNLLKEDGVIFISIDDNEIDNLKKVCNEIFGQNNFVAQIVIEATPKSDPYIVATGHEYCLVFTKNFNIAKISNFGIKNQIYDDLLSIFNSNKDDLPLISELLKKYFEKNNLNSDNIANYKFADKDGIYRIGPIDDPQSSGPKDLRINPKTGNYCKTPTAGWRCNLATWQTWIDNNLIEFPNDDDNIPAKKTYITEDRLDVMAGLIKTQTRKDTDYLKRLFNAEISPFSSPKPQFLLQRLIENCNSNDEIFVDFFSGSNSFMQGIFEVNLKNNWNNKCISVQLPELISLEGAKSNKEKKIAQAAINVLTQIGVEPKITELAKERIRRTVNLLKEQYKVKTNDFDLGFKVFKLDSSNIKGWDGNPEDLEASLFDAQENIKTDRTEEDVLFEILLKYGLDLTLPIDEKLIDGKKVFSVGFGALFICLADDISNKVAEGIGAWKQELNPATCRAIFKDSGFSDVEKANAVQTLKRFGISEIKSI